MPTFRLEVLATVTVLLATDILPVEVKMASAEITKLVPLVMLTMVAPRGIATPLTAWPTHSPDVLVTVTVLLPKVV
jgi:hypothetical protein